jgi:hypothetical protein
MRAHRGRKTSCRRSCSTEAVKASQGDSVKVHVAIATVALAGCGAPPIKSADAMRSAASISAELCSTAGIDVVAQRLATAWSRCFAGSFQGTQAVAVGSTPILVPTRPSTISVRIEPLADGKSVVLEGSGAIGMMLLGDVQRTQSCESRVVVRTRGADTERGQEIGRRLVNEGIGFVNAPDGACAKGRN